MANAEKNLVESPEGCHGASAFFLYLAVFWWRKGNKHALVQAQ